MTEEERNQLMMKAIDNELDVAEKKQFEQLLKNDESFKQEWKEFQQMKAITSTIKLKTPEAEKWELYWQHIYNRIERQFGWILTSIGAMFILGFFAYEFFYSFLFNESKSLLLRIGFGILAMGMIVLFISVLREKLTLRKSDKYKEIIR